MSYYEKQTYPIFLKCCKYIKDDFWLQIFKNMAKGKMPYGIHINNNTTLTTHYKNKKINYVYINKNPKDIFFDLKELFVNNFGLRSELDTKVYKNKLKSNLETITKNRDCNWKSIRRISIQNTLMIKYILKMTEKHSLSKIVAKQLYEDIKTLLKIKTLISEDIILHDGEISKINHISYENNGYKITSNRIYIEKEKKNQPKLMIKEWVKLIDKQNKKKNKKIN